MGMFLSEPYILRMAMSHSYASNDLAAYFSSYRTLIILVLEIGVTQIIIRKF